MAIEAITLLGRRGKAPFRGVGRSPNVLPHGFVEGLTPRRNRRGACLFFSVAAYRLARSANAEASRSFSR